MEVSTRGFTHISMGLLGGISFMFISYTSRKRRLGRLSLLEQLTVVSFFITTSELLCGIVVNLRLGLGIWDYTDMPFNYLGQVCLPFTLLWFMITFLGICVEDAIRIKLFHEDITPLLKARNGRKKAAKDAPLPL